MKANAMPVLAIFETKRRLEVPLFQRQYVWTQAAQWEPLWEDIARKFSEHLSGRSEAPVHFLGAMVLDQKQTPTTQIEKRQVIDGQQRLTTLQIFLAAFRDFCAAHGAIELAKEAEGYTFNRGMMPDPEVDRFKIWPTQLDRAQFVDVVSAGSRQALERKHPLVKKKYARRHEPRPRMVEAYLFFYGSLRDYFIGASSDPVDDPRPLPTRLEECFRVLSNALHVVVIDLDQGDDAQVIFETLNARGQPLLPADLLRNFIFLRAGRAGEPQEQLYAKYWSRFDDEWWRQEVKQGRLLRPRSDLFMQHYLASRQLLDIPISHLFIEYKFWIEKARPFATVEAELESLARQRDHFRRIVQPIPGDVLYSLVTFLDAFDVRTTYPLLLALCDADIPASEWSRIGDVLQSYILRRAVCDLTTKSYNRVFLTVTKAMRREGMTAAVLAAQLAGQTGDSGEWPLDASFRSAWMGMHAYRLMNNPKLVHILTRLNSSYMSAKSEDITLAGPSTVEHIMPQQWVQKWPLLDGSVGLTQVQLWTAPEDDPRTVATRRRDAAVQGIGNLTILTQALNSAVSNGSWTDKKPELLSHSLLPINQVLQAHPVWNEVSIQQRSEDLFERALMIWPRSTSNKGTG